MTTEQSALAHQPSLQELKAPTISFKDRKILMWLYDGKLKKPEKLRRLLTKGYAYINSQAEIEPTVLGMLLIDFTVRQREKAKSDAKRKTHATKPSRQNRVNSFGARKQQLNRDVSVGLVDSGDRYQAELNALTSQPTTI